MGTTSEPPGSNTTGPDEGLKLGELGRPVLMEQGRIAKCRKLITKAMVLYRALHKDLIMLGIQNQSFLIGRFLH